MYTLTYFIHDLEFDILFLLTNITFYFIGLFKKVYVDVFEEKNELTTNNLISYLKYFKIIILSPNFSTQLTISICLIINY